MPVIQYQEGIVVVSRLQEVDFISFYFLSHFYFYFYLFLIFLFLEHLGLGLEVIGYNIDHRTQEKEVEGSRTK